MYLKIKTSFFLAQKLEAKICMLLDLREKYSKIIQITNEHQTLNNYKQYFLNFKTCCVWREKSLKIVHNRHVPIGKETWKGKIWQCLYGSIKRNLVYFGSENYQQKTTQRITNGRATFILNKNTVIYQPSKRSQNVWIFSW